MNRRMFFSGLAAAMAWISISLPAINAAGQKSPARMERKVVHETAREIPIAYRVDVVVVGGSTAGVAAAAAAARQGASVFLASPRPYLGEDLCATLRLELPADMAPNAALTRRIFGNRRVTTPLQVKKALDDALRQAGVQSLHGCYATEVLRDGSGRLAGVVMANRAGRQAVVAKVIIDATDRAMVTRRAGAPHQPWSGGKLTFRRTVLTGNAQGETRFDERVVGFSIPDISFPSLAGLEQAARDKTFQAGQLRASETLFVIPPDPIVCRKTSAAWQAAAALDLDHFRPTGLERLYVLSGCADIPREEAAKLLRPCGLVGAGEQIGTAAAAEAKALSAPGAIRVETNHPAPSGAGDVKELLTGQRPTSRSLQTVPAAAHGLPVLGMYDVVVIGGGTAGAPAAIGAARRGAKTLLVEYLEGLGGVGTLGLIGKPYHGKKVGFASEVPFPDKRLNIEDKMEWYRREARKAGVEIWLGALGCGAFVDGARVKGAVVATPEGRGVALANTVIDATGNADIAIAAGAGYMYGADPDDIALQGVGLPVRPLNKDYVNTDYLLVDESDMVDVSRALTGARATMREEDYDAGTLIQTRERRRVVGDHVLSYLDQIAGRTYPDSIVFSGSDYDSHGYPTHPFFALIPHDRKSRKSNHPAPGGSCYTPYRCLLPKGLDGMLVVGLGISMDRDASAMVRMQLDMANQGYAAGVAAAMAAQAKTGPRGIEIKALQRHLVDQGALPKEALMHEDSFPLPEPVIRAAVEKLAQATNPQTAARPLAIILSHRESALPLLRKSWAAASGPKRMVYARALGMLGDKGVVPELIAAVDGMTAWDAKIFQGNMAEYAHLPTEADSLILALGHTGDARALPALLKKLEMLDGEVTLSHHRAVALALERLGDPAAAEPIARALGKPKMRGHAMTRFEPLHNARQDQRRRIGPLREIVLARALYRCGDHEGLGSRILHEYLNDVRGLFARHAQAVLKER